MEIEGSVAVVTGGASGLGLATARLLAKRGVASVLIVDLPESGGDAVAEQLGAGAVFVPADVTEPRALAAALDAAAQLGPLRIVVHCAGRGGAERLVGDDGSPASLDLFEAVVHTNLVGSFNVLRLAAARMSATELHDGERGVCVLTASIAAFDGQAGQAAYAASKAGIVGMTLVAARDLASHQIRVCAIAPGPFDTPMLAALPRERREALADMVPHPRRLGLPVEFAALACHIIDNPMLNGEVIRLDGALRMSAR